MLSSRPMGGPFNTASIWKWLEVPEEWQRALYSEMSSTSTGPSSLLVVRWKAESRTGVPFDQLRFQYWNLINKLLVRAEDFELRARASSVTRRYINESGMMDTDPRKIYVFQKDVVSHLASVEEETLKTYTYEEWRARIPNLRSPQYQPSQPLREQRSASLKLR